MAPSQAPKYLTGDAKAIDEFIDKFDVRHFLSSMDSYVFLAYLHAYHESRPFC